MPYKNIEDRREHQRKRYAEDPEFREKVKDRSRVDAEKLSKDPEKVKAKNTKQREKAKFRWDNDPEYRNKRIAAHKEWSELNSEKSKSSQSKHRSSLKAEVLTHYGKEGKLQCCWEVCCVDDIDMLTLDHINNDGAEDRRAGRNGTIIYRYLKKECFPFGFQTLCWNHQWKKEINKLKGIT